MAQSQWQKFDEYRKLRVITEDEPDDEFQSFLSKARPSAAEIADDKWADED